jgi:transposase-like protein
LGDARPVDLHRGHRFPAEIIAHAVWLYHVFSLSLRDVELLLAEPGVTTFPENHRHSGLRVHSPREFIRGLSQPAAFPR